MVLPTSKEWATISIQYLLAGYTILSAAGFGTTNMFNHIHETTMHRSYRLYMLKNSRRVFDMVTRNSCRTERRLMLEMEKIRKIHRSMEIDRLAHVSVVASAADADQNYWKCYFASSNGGMFDHSVHIAGVVWKVLNHDEEHYLLAKKTC